ncbi:hypothetical protein LJC04_02850 [Ruminococcaceae bacterium OttesenSCG-928-O06]|nr:hypothetical protein [Ruminococcaceae bacterium OttesenSCG-928-O06]
MNPAKNEKMRQKVMMKPGVEQARKDLDADPQNPDLWYIYAMALGNAGQHEEAVDAFSQGLIHNPFDADLYFGRGRKHNHCGRFHSAIADLTMAIRIEPEVWTHWYYRATTYNLAGKFAESAADFEDCIHNAEDWERCPMVFWLYTTCVELGDFDGAKKALTLIPDDITPPQMDYGYNRCIQLFKGFLTPENFIEPKDVMEAKILKQPQRWELELNTMYLGLYYYQIFNGNEAAADDALRELMKIPFPNAFGWLRGEPIARRRGLV